MAPSRPDRAYHLRPELERLPRYIPGLSAEDLKDRRTPSGAPQATAQAAAGPQAADEAPVKLSSNENPLGPSPRAVEAVSRAAWEAHRYPDSECRRLRAALSRRWDLPEEQIVVANGTDNVITLVAQVLLGPGCLAAIPAITFAAYEIAARLSGADVEKVPMNGAAIDVEGMARALVHGARVAFVANPNNPTGAILTAAEVERLVAAVPDGSALVLDEAYAEFVSNPAYPDGAGLVRRGEPVVVLRTFSKAYGLAGLRVGYALAPAPVA
ncbi:MAG: histidinol-phosphate transaminase, partial [Bacillota bacterium]